MSLSDVLGRFFGTAATAPVAGSAYPYLPQTMARITPTELPPRYLYAFLKQAYLTNGLYDQVRASWAATGYASPNLKAIRNPIAAVVDVLGSKLYPDPLTVTTPLTQGITSQQEREELSARDPVKAAIEQVWQWSNWSRVKRKHARWTALYGEAFIKVVADPVAGRVYFDLIEPQCVTSYDADVRDYITDIRLDIPQVTENRAGLDRWVYTEVWSKAEQRVRIWRTPGTLDSTAGTHPDDLGAPAEEIPLSAFGIDFVPLVRAPFREIDDGRALGAVLPALEAIIEADLSATNLHGTVFSELAGAKVLKAVGLDAAGRPLPAPVVGAAAANGQAGRQSDDTVTVGRREFWRLPGNMELEDVIPNINYAAALAILQDHDAHLERMLPALTYCKLSELTGGDLSGKAITYKMRAFVDQVAEGRSNLLAALKQADMMALTMGQAAGILSVPGSFDAGDFEHEFEDTPILHISSLDEAEEKRARAQAAQAYASAGVPLGVILVDTMEMTEAEATEVVDTAAEEAEEAFNRQAELAAAQPSEDEDDAA